MGKKAQSFSDLRSALLDSLKNSEGLEKNLSDEEILDKYKKTFKSKK